jgi:hypothetical protein
MPACRHGKSCKIKNCHLKHVDDQEVMECVFFKQGFCYNGPNCVRRHIKRLPDEVPKEASFEQCISVTNAGATGVTAKKRKGPNENYKVSLCNHWLLSGTCHFNEECHFAHGEDEIQEGYQSDQFNDVEVYDPTRNRLDADLILPFSEKARISYFLFQAPDLRACVVSKRRGVWSVPSRLAAEINSALRAYDHVVAFVAVRPLKGIYGVMKIAGAVTPAPAHLNNMALTPEFPVMWIRTMRVSMRTVAQLKIGTTGVFVGRTYTDSKFESKVGSEIMYISYRKPSWDWSQEGQLHLAEQSLAAQRIANGEPAVPMLPPDVLFPPDWFIKTTSGALGHRNTSSSHSDVLPNIVQVQQEFYTLDHPGFLFNASGMVAEEMIAR